MGPSPLLARSLGKGISKPLPRFLMHSGAHVLRLPSIVRPPSILRLCCAPSADHLLPWCAVQSTIPDPHPNSPLSGRDSFGREESPRALVHNTPRPSNIGPLQLAITTSREDFRTLQDPFASPSSPLTEKPFPLFEAARKKTLSLLVASTRHSSPADLRLPPVLLPSLEDDTPPLSPPAAALVRAPKHASISGAF